MSDESTARERELELEIDKLRAVAVFLLTNWSDPTHRLVFATAMLAFLSLAFSLAALATKRQAGEQRILRAIEMLHEMEQEKRDGN